MILGQDMTFPLHVLTNILYYTPQSPSPPLMLDGPINRECSTQTDRSPGRREERAAGFEKPIASGPHRVEVACQTVTACEGRVETTAGLSLQDLPAHPSLRDAPAVVAASADVCGAAHEDEATPAGVAGLEAEREAGTEGEAESEADFEGEDEADVEADFESEAEVEDEADIEVVDLRLVPEESAR